KSLLKFLTTYFPHSTGLKPFSDDHKRMIGEMERCIRGGGRMVNAVYRGFAKTTISENAVIWAALYGLRRFVLLVGINKHESAGNIDSIKAELAENDLLAADFPEVCLYIRALKNKPQRAPHQTCDGRHTHIVWRADTLVMPTIKGSVASGVIITARPYGKARGIKYKRRDGLQVRPDLAIVDDPQNDESAATQARVNKNLTILRKGICQTAGRGKGLAVVINATIIAPDDMIETLLADPAWQGQRVPMIKKWADAHDTLWLKEYSDIRRTFDRTVPADQDRAHRAATAFYRSHRREMDAGCLVSWKYCRNANELSAIQHAYDILIDDGEDVFQSEYQQDPVPSEKERDQLTPGLVAGKGNGLARGVVPSSAEFVTAHIDVHDRVLYWSVGAWSPTFEGFLVDYGTHPRQSVRYFAQATAPKTLARLHPGKGKEGSILAGLTELTERLLSAEWEREDGVVLRIGRLLIDARYNRDLVVSFCRRSPHAAVILPAMGFFCPRGRVWSEFFATKEGGRSGFHWRLPPPQKGERVLLVDVNWWKTLAWERLRVALGDTGCWSLFGREPIRHQLLADHFCSERAVWVEAKGLGRYEWEWKPGRPDNHWWDTFVGSAAAAATMGATIPGAMERRGRKRRTRKRVQYAEG
ncbi:MAG: phage terminase large subunit family protein, partial [Sedimentisphaerales bacterium]|nr:phage terminase large subunit family protein [Sedimentisphaerales bacterium]